MLYVYVVYQMLMMANQINLTMIYCESYKICPLFMNKAAPVGKLCPLEKFKVNRITQELINELDIDIFEDYTDKYIIGELVYLFFNRRPCCSCPCF